MKKIIFTLVILVIAFSIYWFKFRTVESFEGEKAVSLKASIHSGIFNNSIDTMMSAYFNLKDAGMSTSFVTVDGSVVADPNNNKLLLENPKLKAFLPQILNRTEVRFLEEAGGKRTIPMCRTRTMDRRDLHQTTKPRSAETA